MCQTVCREKTTWEGKKIEDRIAERRHTSECGTQTPGVTHYFPHIVRSRKSIISAGDAEPVGPFWRPASPDFLSWAVELPVRRLAAACGI